MFRVLETWPDTDHHNRLTRKGFCPQRLEGCEVIEKDGVSVVGTEGELQYMPYQFRDDVRSEASFLITEKAIEDVVTGRIPKWEGTGNAWTTIIFPDRVIFEYSIMDGEPGGQVSLITYRLALKAWRDFLADESCDERIIELPD
ncbi:hypothetical protein [Variovorax sp. JS1663]|uniref:hypothetical protein n=1 Tax=Variovorax sp. JS1663 TaxID=1851577 RepID=UPI000B345F30|nr:hypothetical protein [Variovorax sp. JS1663]OUM03381.1 hypothetical protein A8M77_06950 [Variovorax sp. JS1663]